MFTSILRMMMTGVASPLQSPAERKPAAHSDEPPPARSARRQQVKAQSDKPTAASVPSTTSKVAKAASLPVPAKALASPAKKVAAAKAATPPAKTAPVPAFTPKATSVVPSSSKSSKGLSSPAPIVSAKPMIQPPKAAVPPVVPAPAPGIPPRSTRPSSRLTQLTVPSMAQSVASTAAKASYLQTMPITMIAPPSPTAVKKDAKLANNWKTKSVEALTQEELLAMPDSEYMNEKQMAYFRMVLVRLKIDMQNNAGETTEHLREDTVVVPDPADRATIEEEHALELRTRDRERKLLKKIEQSIQSIDAGDYGYCDETGEPIGVGRLLARPTATLSLEAQQRRELKQKMFGD